MKAPITIIADEEDVPEMVKAFGMEGKIVTIIPLGGHKYQLNVRVLLALQSIYEESVK